MIQQAISLLGLRASDRVTGFSGVISTVGFDLYGCVQAVVTPSIAADGKLGEGHWFDLKRLNTGERVMVAPSFDVPPGTEPGAAEKPRAMPHG